MSAGARLAKSNLAPVATSNTCTEGNCDVTVAVVARALDDTTLDVGAADDDAEVEAEAEPESAGFAPTAGAEPASEPPPPQPASARTKLAMATPAQRREAGRGPRVGCDGNIDRLAYRRRTTARCRGPRCFANREISVPEQSSATPQERLAYSPPVTPALGVPATVEEMTAGWLSAALGTPVAAVAIEPLGEGVGFLGDLARLHVSYHRPATGPATMIAKLPTHDPGGQAVGRMLGAWARESLFFADLAPRCPARVPACYYNGADAANQRWALLLEDCGPGQPTDQVQGATRAQALAAIEELARFHATWSGHPRPAEWLPGFDRGPLSALQDTVCDAIDGFIARYGQAVPHETVGWLSQFAPRLAVWSQHEAHQPLTVVHADYRLDNLIFNGDGTVTILDWQTALVGNGAMDLTSFLLTSLSVDNRRAWQDELVDLYANGIGLTREAVWERVRSHVLWWMALYANNLSRISPDDPRGKALFDQMIVGTFTAAVDLSVGELLDAV